MFYYVYVLKSEITKKHYTGSTSNLRKRLKEHNSGKTKSIKSGIPWELFYYEVHRDKNLAIKAELHYKTGQGRRQIKKKLGIL